MPGLEQSVKLKIKLLLTYRRFNEIIIYSTFFIIMKNLYSINWTKEFNGISSNEKINLSNGGTISHYKNFGNWKDSLGNYGTKMLWYNTN